MHFAPTARSARRCLSAFVIAGFLSTCFLLGTMATRADAALTPGLQWSGTYAESESPAEMNVIQRSGAKLFRIPVSKTTFDVYGWKPFDDAFDYAAQRGISILPYLYGRAGDGARFPTAAEYGSWGSWVNQVVERYGVGGYFWAGKPYARPAEVWEVWNEPNLAANNPKLTKAQCEAIPSPYNATAETCAQPRNYGKFLAFTASTIRGKPQGANATVLFGGLYGYAAPQAFNFLEDAHKEAGVLAAYNGLAFHPYAFSPNHIEVFTSLINTARATLNTLGGSAKSIWITEMGWQVEYAHEGWGPVNLDEQAVLLREAFTWLQANSAAKNIQSAIWSSYRDHPANIPNWAYHSGLRNIDGTFRPAWYAFQQQTGAPQWPTGPWTTENLGGNLTLDPAIDSRVANRLDVFARGTDGALWQMTWNGSNWSSWFSLGGGLTSGPNAVSWDGTRVDVVMRGGDGAVWHYVWNGAAWSTETLGGGVVGSPEISSQGPGQLDVFARGLDNALWQRSFNGGSWSSWHSLGGNLTSSPGAVSWGPGRVDVVTRGSDNAVWHWVWNGIGWGVGSLGGSIASAPDVSTLGPGYLDLFARGGNSLWHRSFNSGAWGPWVDLGVPMASSPSAVSWSNARTDVVHLNSSGNLIHTYWSP